jgi:hypothetical protein
VVFWCCFVVCCWVASFLNVWTLSWSGWLFWGGIGSVDGSGGCCCCVVVCFVVRPTSCLNCYSGLSFSVLVSGLWFVVRWASYLAICLHILDVVFVAVQLVLVFCCRGIGFLD